MLLLLLLHPSFPPFDRVHIDLPAGEGVPLPTHTYGQQLCGLKLMWNNNLVLF